MLKQFIATTTPLNAGQTFSSNGKIDQSFGDAKSLVGHARSDQEFSVKIEQSTDGTNWDYVTDYRSEPEGGGYQCGYEVPRLGVYARLRIICGTTNMTALRAVLHLQN